MIKKLLLNNWKSHKSSEFIFSEGTNVLVGIMGSGKSSIMDAVTFALFGTFPSLSQRKLKIEDVVLRGESSAYVELTFELDNEEYTVKRSIEKGRTATSELYHGKTLIESPQASKVTESVESIIKMDYDLFIRAIYAEQNAIDYFLTIPRGQRMKKIDTLLKLDKFETARANANTVINKIKDEKKMKMTLLERLELSDTIKSYEKIKQEAKFLRQKILDYEMQSLSIKKELDVTKKEIESLEQQEKLKVEFDKRFITIKTSTDELEKRAKELSDILNGKLFLTDRKDLEEEYSKTKKKLESIHEDLKKHETEETTIKTRIDLQKAIDIESSKKLRDKEIIEKEIETTGDIEEIKNKLIEVSKELDLQKRLLFSSKSEIDHQKEHIEKLSKDGCPVCDRELSEDLYEKIRSRKEIKIHDLESIVSKSSIRIEELEEERKSLDLKRVRLELLIQKNRSYEDEEKRQKDIRKALEELNTKLPTIERNIKSLRSNASEVEQNVKRVEKELNDIKYTEEKKLELSSIRERLEVLYSEKRKMDLLKTDFDPEILKAMRNRHEKILSQKAMIDSQVNSEKRVLEEKQERLDNIESQRETIETLKKEIDDLEEYQKQMKLLSETLERTQSRLRQEFVQTVNIVMSEIWRQFYPYQDYVDIRLAIEEGDYVLELLAREWLSVEGVASGGERSSAALVLRIALALVLAPNLRWLILDEPTHNLDANAIEQLSTILRHKISEFVDQVFLITHEPRLEDAVSGYLYRLDRPDNKRSPTQIQKIDIMKD